MAFRSIIVAFAVITLGATIIIATRVSSGAAPASAQLNAGEVLAAELAGYYREHQHWDGVSQLTSSSGVRSFTVTDTSGRVIVAGAGHHVGMVLSPVGLAGGSPILAGSQRVGTLVIIIGADREGSVEYWKWAFAAPVLAIAGLWLTGWRTNEAKVR
jgi:hypothetical protein